MARKRVLTKRRKTKQVQEQTLGQVPALMRLVDVARELNVSTRQVRRLLASGRFYPADVSLGGLRGRRWRRDRFLRWIEAGAPHADAWASAA